HSDTVTGTACAPATAEKTAAKPAAMTNRVMNESFEMGAVRIGDGGIFARVPPFVQARLYDGNFINPTVTNNGTITATSASPAINPDASGIEYFSWLSGETFAHTRSDAAPTKITDAALNGISIAIPIPVGDGMNLSHSFFCSITVNTMPTSAPTRNDDFI